jgi:hypothetical protein
MNSRNRFLETMRFGAPDRVPYLDEGFREGVLSLWRRQGLPRRADLFKVFQYDRREHIQLDLDPHPAPRKWPSSRPELDRFRNSMDPTRPNRLPRRWPDKVRAWKNRDHILILEVHNGFFLSMGVRGWERFYEVIFLLKDDPRFVRELMGIQGNLSAALTDRILQDIDIDAALFLEPIGGSDRPLLSPEMYEEFALSSYEPVLQVLRNHRVENVIFLTFGNPRVLLPCVIKRGFNCLWACETNPQTMDYRDLRKEFGRDLRLIGGIDLDALRRGKEHIRREIEEKVPPLLEEGGYIPLADGRVREDIPYQNYVYYRRLLEDVTGSSVSLGAE